MMREKINKIVILVLISVSVTACKTPKNITGGKIKNYQAAELDSIIKQNQFEFSTFSGKAKVDIGTANTNQSISAQIDIKKDSAIGISLRFIGIEGARILITPDSIKILDRLKQKYIARNFAYIEQNFSLSITFADLQNLITGNIIYYNGNKYTGTAADKYILIAESYPVKNTIWLYPSFDVMKLFIEDIENKRTLTLDYNGYKKLNNKHFAYLRHILIDAVEKYTIDMQFTTVTLNQPFDFDFRVNPTYEKVE